MFFVENLKNEGNKNLIIAINSWLLINIGAMINELYKLSYEIKDLIYLINFILTITGIVSIICLIFSKNSPLSKFKKL